MTSEKRETPGEPGKTQPSARGTIITLYLVGGVILIGGVLAARRIWTTVPDSVLDGIAAVSLVWIIAAHAVIVVRREAPRSAYRSTFGRWAVAQGILGLIVWGGFEVIVLYALLRDLLGK